MGSDPGPRPRRRSVFRRRVLWAFLVVTLALTLLGRWRFPMTSDGLLILRTAEALAFEGTFVLPPAGEGASLHPWFFRPAVSGGRPGFVSKYQPFGSLWRAAAFTLARLAPAGATRGRTADALIGLGQVLLTAWSVFPLARLLRAGGLAARWSPPGAAALVLGSFLGRLASLDFSEPGLVLFLALALDSCLRASRRRGAARVRGLAWAGALAVASNLVKPVGAAVLPCLLVPLVFGRSRKTLARDLGAMAGGAVLPAVVFLTLTFVRTGKLLEVGYLNEPLADMVSPLWTLLRITLLPNRGLLWFAPLSLLAVPGAVRLLGSGQRRAAGIAALLGFGAFFVINLLFWAWEGGMGWGPRYLAPALALLAPALGAGMMAFPRTSAVLASAGFLLNLSGYLLDHQRIYESVAAEVSVPRPIGPIPPLHRGGGPGDVHPLQRVHYVPSRAPVFVGPRLLLGLFEGKVPVLRASRAEWNDGAALRALIGLPVLRPEPDSGRALFDEAAVSVSARLERALRFAELAIDFGGPPVDARALGSYLALRAGRLDEAERFCLEGLALDPSRRDLRGNLEVIRQTRKPPAPGR